MSSWSWKRRLGLAFLALALAAPPLAFGISNLYLVSPKGRAFIAAKISRLLPLETSVQGATWSPWNGITVYGLRAEQPPALRKAFGRPLVSVESVRIHPDWMELARKRLSIKGMEIVKPELCIPIELLSQIQQKEDVPVLAATNPNPATARPQAQVPAAPEGGVPSPPPSAGAGQRPHVLTAPPSKPTEPTTWMDVRGGSLRIVTLMLRTPLFHASGINGGVPLAGKDATSLISIERLTGTGGTAPGKTEIPLKWSAPALTAGTVDGGIFGLDFRIGAQVGLVQGLPFLVECVVPEQNGWEMRTGSGLEAKAGKIAAQGRVQGYLQAPATWQGQWIVEAGGVDAGHGAQRNRFERGQAIFLFQNGALRCPDARLVSEEACIIGNGMLLSDGRLAANARVIASPEALAAISKFTQPGGKAPHLTPLSTPQRSALDLQLYGRPGVIFFKPDPMAEPLRLR
ncbi:hypothetical protein HZ994_17650 [Akkermansiaceae bacterium]|nr:hypothetical protein HZ994_17650 [Akkermansiaceae bacterium]